MWNEGHTAREIGITLGFSRNAVVGKILRLREKNNSMRAKAIVNKKINGKALDEFHEAFAPPPAVIQHKTLLDLEPGECRWPLGDMMSPVDLFCGAAILGVGYSYCKTHFNLSRKRGSHT